MRPAVSSWLKSVTSPKGLRGTARLPFDRPLAPLPPPFPLIP